MPYELPRFDQAAFDAAWVEKPTKWAMVPDATYDRMIVHYETVGPKKFKYKLQGLNSQACTVRFRKDLGFWFENNGYRHIVIYSHEPTNAEFGIDFPDSEEQERIREANYTGNHYRNHRVRVPTAPGQPVRG